MKLNSYPGAAAMTVRRAEHQEAMLVIYSAFLIVFFISLRVFNRTLKHNSLLNRDGGTAATR
jgi:hypothetical protein